MEYHPRGACSFRLAELGGGRIVRPTLPTCGDNCYDYFVVATRLAPAIVGCQRVENAGYTPHWPSRLLIRGDARRLCEKVLAKPPPVPGTLPPGPHHPHQPATQPATDTADGADLSQLTGWFDHWRAAAYGEWGSLLGQELQDRAPSTSWQPLLGRSRDGWESGSRTSVAWRKLAASMQEVLATTSATEERTQQQWAAARRHLGRARHLAQRMDGPTSRAHPPTHLPPSLLAPDPAHMFVQFCGHISERRWGQARALVHVVRVTAQRHVDHEVRAERSRWREWLRGGVNQPAGRGIHRNAFAYVRGGAGWIRSPELNAATQQAPEEGTTLDDADGALASDEVQQLSGEAILDAASPIWVPRLLDRPVLGHKAPASDQQDVDLETRYWSSLWEQEADPDFVPELPPELLALGTDLPPHRGGPQAGGQDLPSEHGQGG